MSDLLQQLSSFLNLSKLVAVTVPGMIATLALMLFFNPPACKQDSESCWYCQGQDKTGSESKPNASAPSRQKGTYMVSKLRWEQANQSYRIVRNTARTDIGACSQLPEYFVIASRLKAEKETVKDLRDLQPIDPGTFLENLDDCNAVLTQAQNELNQKDVAEATIITARNTNFTAASTAFQTARANNNSDLAAALDRKLEDAKEALTREMQHDSELKSATSAVGALVTQITTWRTNLMGDVTTLVPAETPTKTTWQHAAQALANHILMFLLVSIAVGQLLDPIQRAIVSSDPVRGLTFPVLNFFYSRKSLSGAIRFGDQRYESTRSEDVKPLVDREPHLLEASYAIGRGYLTQAEYSAMQDQYYSQSQIANGLMLPMAMLAVAIYIRLLCCKMVEFGQGGVFWCALVSFALLLLFSIQVFQQ
jgi:hypothetical protein